MCGITGMIHWHEDMSQYETIIKQMTKTLNHRGPDAQNHWTNKHVAFGHTRLSVVDPEGGHQPMTCVYDDKAYTIIYNGELYNTDEIRKQLLEYGHRFHSHSDTEVLLKAYVQWGEHCLNQLNGIYAFAIWSDYNEQLFIARDRLGVKPLFFTQKNGYFIFGSELKAILSHPSVETKVDSEGLANIFGLSPSRTPGHGLFKGIRELRPAHALKLNRDGLHVFRYWQLESHPHTDSFEETIERIHFLLKDAIQRQLVADVPICTLLSGGLDSSAISAFAAAGLKKEGRGELNTYSVDYVDNEQYFKANAFQPNSDDYWINIMTNHLQSTHYRKVIGYDDLVSYLDDAVLYRDQPGMADIDSSLLWFCEQIKVDATVALSGECADEIFGGYPWFQNEKLMHRPTFPWMDSIKERENLLNDTWKQKLSLADYVQTKYSETVREVPYLEGENEEDARRRELFYLNIIWFMTTLLDRKDRMSMGASLEVRVPFADHHLVEYVWNIPWKLKQYNGQEKGILRQALKGVLPDAIINRKKSPYPKTHHPQYTENVKKLLQNVLRNKDAPLFEFVEREKIEQLVETNGESFTRPWFGQLMTGPQLMAHLYQINFWLQTYNVTIEQ